MLLYLFDPTQDQRFRQLCQNQQINLGNIAVGRTARQESVLLEAAARVRRYSGLAQNAKHNRPLIVVVTKWDAWVTLLQDKNVTDPWLRRTDQVAALDVAWIERRSQEIRSLLLKVTPEVVTAAEGFASHVVYVPVSALGRSPEMDARTGKLAIRPRLIRPLWATVPFLYGMIRAMPGMLTAGANTALRAAPAQPGKPAATGRNTGVQAAVSVQPAPQRNTKVPPSPPPSGSPRQ